MRGAVVVFFSWTLTVWGLMFNWNYDQLSALVSFSSSTGEYVGYAQNKPRP